MIQFKNLYLIGSSHIAQQSLNEVKDFIVKDNPDIVALELDKGRFYALISKKSKRRANLSDIKRVGFKGFLFQVIGSFVSKKLGKIVNVNPGDEMLMAIKLSKKRNIALIDRDIHVTLKRFSKSITWKEKFRIVGDVIKGIFLGKKNLEKYGIKGFDLTKVPSPDLIRKMVNIVKQRYPNFYNVLVRERDVFMANNLIKLVNLYPDKKILAIVGAGHVDGISKLIKKHKFIN